MAHPPGSETSAQPYFANKGPKIKKDALIFLTKSYETLKFLGLELSIVQKSFFFDILNSMIPIFLSLEKISDNLGTFFNFFFI